ncbi:MAG: hypothetical protein ABSF70_09965 [Terracidiphilus sp.]
MSCDRDRGIRTISGHDTFNNLLLRIGPRENTNIRCTLSPEEGFGQRRRQSVPDGVSASQAQDRIRRIIPFGGIGPLNCVYPVFINGYNDKKNNNNCKRYYVNNIIHLPLAHTVTRGLMASGIVDDFMANSIIWNLMTDKVISNFMLSKIICGPLASNVTRRSLVHNILLIFLLGWGYDIAERHIT